MNFRATRNQGTAAGALCAALTFAPLAAEAQSYRCVDKNGRKIYGEVIPAACLGQWVEQLSAQGIVVRRIAPPPTPKQLADTAAEEQKRRDDEEAEKIQARRDNALLSTYPTIGSIDEARARALRQADAAVKEIEDSLEQLRRRETELEQQLATYKGGRQPPVQPVEDLHQVRLDLASQSALLAVKRKDIEAINARYDEDKKRYADLNARRR